MNRRVILLRVLGGLLVVAALVWFAYLNYGRLVDVDFGIFTVRRVSLALVIYAALVGGALFMFLVGMRGDLRTGQALERYNRIAADLRAEAESSEKK
jgi:hypothetical protein